MNTAAGQPAVDEAEAAKSPRYFIVLKNFVVKARHSLQARFIENNILGRIESVAHKNKITIAQHGTVVVKRRVRTVTRYTTALGMHFEVTSGTPEQMNAVVNQLNAYLSTLPAHEQNAAQFILSDSAPLDD